MSSKEELLIVEDDEQIARQLKWALAEDYNLHLAQDGQAALKIVQSKKPAVVTLDLGLPPKPDEATVGMEILGKILECEPNTKIIVVTGNGLKENSLRAINRGAWDYYAKPIEIEELKVILSRAFHVSRLEKENLELQQEMETKARFDELIGSSPQMNEIFGKIRKVATSDVSVLVAGESGTGKELIARAIHNQSARKRKPFVAINCGAIPETLLEAELFGHEKGAYTGAHIQRKGKVEYADGGTLFLDEIGEMPLFLQVKLLRFLQEHIIERIGGREIIEVDVRIIAATQKNLLEALPAGEFREDLYYRLSVVTIDVPPLRSRGEDVVLLANYFMRKSCQEMNRSVAKFDPTALQAIVEYDWPGNVRELENKIMRSVVMGQGRVIRAEDLDLPFIYDFADKKQTLKDVREELEREFISKALSSNSWNVAKTAEVIGVTRPTLYDLIRKYDLKKQEMEMNDT
ncbi:MAG: PEP-CTERM-box response regulator transcription factor [Deltaproteobacteria bacterium]